MFVERRADYRIPVDELPQCLKSVAFKSGFSGSYSATAINASNYGMSFICNNLEYRDLKEGESITIKIMPYNFKLKAKVVYIQDSGDEGLKFGINFKAGYPVKKYQEILNNPEM